MLLLLQKVQNYTLTSFSLFHKLDAHSTFSTLDWSQSPPSARLEPILRMIVVDDRDVEGDDDQWKEKIIFLKFFVASADGG